MDPTEHFLRLAELSGWNNEEIARRLRVTPQYIGQIKNGHAEASRVVTLCLELTMKVEKMDLTEPLPRFSESAQDAPVIAKMRQLQADDVEAFHALAAIIDRLHRKPAKSTVRYPMGKPRGLKIIEPVSSSPPPDVAARAERAADATPKKSKDRPPT